MSIPIRKFGQYVLLQVHNEKGDLIFQTDSLKVDFDVRHIKGWSRAKFTITNLSANTIRNISDANSKNFVTIYTALHDSPLGLVADRMYISNAIEEVVVPESIFSLYCYSKLRKLFLEKQVDIKISKPTLRKIIDSCLRNAEFKGTHDFKHFPSAILDFESTGRASTRRQGSLISILDTLGDEYKFNTYTDSNRFIFMYKPDSKNVTDTDFYTSEGDIKLSTTNMRTNPKIGPSTLSIISNLDTRIKPATVLDISNLLTLGTDTPEQTLQVAENYLREKVAGFSKYQTLAVQHKGSNWADVWFTQVSATSPTPGISMATTKWWA